MCHFSRTLCSLSVPEIQEQVELHAVLRTEIMGKNTCLDSLQWLSSVTFYLKDYPFCCNWWNFILNGWVIILLKIYTHPFLQIKYSCFTWDLGLPCPSFLQLLFIDSSPQVPFCKDHNNDPEERICPEDIKEICRGVGESYLILNIKTVHNVAWQCS